MLEVASGSFLSQTSTGTVVAVSGLSFQPKVVLVWGTVRADTDGSDSDSYFCVGASSGGAGGTQRFGMCSYSQNGALLSNTSRALSNTGFIRALTADNVLFLAANLTLLNADGFSINWLTVQASQYEFFYLALGGAELSAFVGTVNTGTGAGTFSRTGVGFQPNLNLFFWDSNSTNSDGVGLTNTIAIAKSSSNGFLSGYREGDALLPTVEKSAQLADRVAVTVGAAAITERISFVSNDSDGFTLNKVDAPSFSKGIGFISLSGLSSALSTFSQKTSTGSQSVTGIPFTPKALLTLTDGLASSASVQANAQVALGCALSSSNRRAAAACGSDNQIVTSLAGRRSTEAAAITILSDGTPTVVAEADFTSFDILSGYTINWGTADATAREIISLALGDAPPSSGDGNSRLLLMGVGG